MVKSGGLYNWKILEDERDREIQDKVSKDEYLQRVESAHSLPDSLCVDSGMGRPKTDKSCGIMDCPTWVAPSWEPCENSKCIAKNTGE